VKNRIQVVRLLTLSVFGFAVRVAGDEVSSFDLLADPNQFSSIFSEQGWGFPYLTITERPFCGPAKSPWWTDFSAMPKEIADAFANSSATSAGFRVLPVTLVLNVETGIIAVETDSTNSVLSLSQPTGYDAPARYNALLYAWNPFVCAGDIDSCAQQLQPQRLVLHVFLADINDHENCLLADQEAGAKGQAGMFTAMEEGEGGGEFDLLSVGSTQSCGRLLFNKLQAQGTNFFLEWLSASNATYEIAGITDITVNASNWVSLASLYPAAAGTNLTSYTDIGGTVRTAKFYKVAKTGISIALCDSNTYSGMVDVPIEVGMPTNKILSGLTFLVDDDGSRAMINPQPPFASRPSGTFDTTLVTNGWHTIQAVASYPNGAVDGGYDVYTSQVVVVRTQNHVTFPDMLFTWGTKLAVRATLDIQITNWSAVILSPSNQPLRAYSGITSNARIDFVWDGKDSNGVTFAGEYVDVEINDPVRRRFRKEGPPPLGYFIVSYMPLFPDSSHGLLQFQNMIDNVALTVEGGPYGLVVGNDTSGAWQISEAGGSYGWIQWAFELASNSTHNVFFFGHGSDNSIGNRDKDGASGFKVNELAPFLGNTTVSNTPSFNQPFHFIFLDACNAGNGPWCEAFGIERITTTSAYYTTNGVTARTFVSWRTAKGYAVIGTIFNAVHRDFITNLFDRWSTTSDGFQDAVNYAASHTTGASGYPSDMRIWGARDLLWNSL
jgi:hypothetical protein